MTLEHHSYPVRIILGDMAQEIHQPTLDDLEDPLKICDLLFQYLETDWVILTYLPTLSELVDNLKTCLEMEYINHDIYQIAIEVLLIKTQLFQIELISLFGRECWFDALAYLNSELN